MVIFVYAILFSYRFEGPHGPLELLTPVSLLLSPLCIFYSLINFIILFDRTQDAHFEYCPQHEPPMAML